MIGWNAFIAYMIENKMFRFSLIDSKRNVSRDIMNTILFFLNIADHFFSHLYRLKSIVTNKEIYHTSPSKFGSIHRLIFKNEPVSVKKKWNFCSNYIWIYIFQNLKSELLWRFSHKWYWKVCWFLFWNCCHSFCWKLNRRFPVFIMNNF